MIPNFIKSIIASLLRRKHFAFFTILSIALSVVGVTCAATFWSLLHRSLPPENDKNQLRFIIPKVDIDRTDFRLWHRPNEIRKAFLNKYVDQLKAMDVDHFVPIQLNDGEDIFYNNRQFRVELAWSSSSLFEVFNFEFNAGSPFRKSETIQAEMPIVISEELATRIFGGVQCLGEKVLLSNHHKNAVMKIVGVIKPVGPWSLFFKKDIILPIDIKTYPYYNIIIKKSNREWEGIDRTLNKMALDFNKDLDEASIELKTTPYFESYASIKGLDFLTETPILIPFLIILIFLPSACIIHLLQSLFNDRLEEMGIRKAMGASTSHIIYQVISESIFIILVSGLLSILVSIPFWNLLLDVPMSVVIKDILNWQVFFYTLLAYVIVGLIIGWLSSIKLAKGSIVEYLNLSGG